GRVIRHDEDVGKAVCGVTALTTARRNLQRVGLARCHQPGDTEIVPFPRNGGDLECIGVQNNASDNECPTSVHKTATAVRHYQLINLQYAAAKVQVAVSNVDESRAACVGHGQ